MKAVEEMGYQEVRSELVKLGLPATGKSNEVRERLSQARSQSGLAGAAAQLPLDEAPVTKPHKKRLSTLTAATDEPKTATKSSKRKSVLPTPVKELPGKAVDALAVAGNAAEEAAADVTESLQGTWASVREAMTPASVTRSARRVVSQARRETTNTLEKASSLLPSWLPLQFLLGLLTGALLVTFFHPAAWSDARATALRGYDGVWAYSSTAGGIVYRSFNEAFPRGRYASQGEAGAGGGCRAAAWAGPLERALLPPPETASWAEAAADLRAALEGFPTLAGAPGGGAPLHKGLGLLLVSDSAAATELAVAQLERIAPQSCAGCLLRIGGGQLAQGGDDARGALQAALVAALRRCPTGALAVIDIAELIARPSMLPVLINALSEQGHLTADGRQLSSTGMVVIVTMAAPRTVLAAAVDEDAFKSAAKAHFVAVFSDLGGESGSSGVQVTRQGSDARGLAEVLRRRFDLVVPLTSLQRAGHRSSTPDVYSIV